MIKSPCINVCKMDAASGLCRGCSRTLDEIAAWSRLDDAARSTILAAVAASMRYRGLFDARPEDWIGFGLTWIDMSSHYARNQRYMNQISGATDYNDPAYQPVAGHSLNGELYYRFRPVS